MKLKLYLLYTLIGILTLQSCGPGHPGVWKNGQIDDSKRNNFHKLNDELFVGIKANKPKDVEILMSRPLLEANNYIRTIELMSLQSQLGSYDMLDEYYIVNNKPTDTHSITTKATDGSPYTFNCTTVTEEMYIALMVPKTHGDKFMITAVYCKYDYGWKLNVLAMEPYTITRKTAPELYKSAMNKLSKGYVVDAFIEMDIAEKCLQPSQVWTYPKNEEMGKDYGKIIEYLNSYKYPLVIDKVATKPRIFQVTHLSTDEGIFPSVDYISTIDLKDTVALEKEKEEIKSSIGTLFPGIDKDKRYIYFTAFNQKPSANKTVPFFDMVGKLPWVDIK